MVALGWSSGPGLESGWLPLRGGNIAWEKPVFPWSAFLTSSLETYREPRNQHTLNPSLAKPMGTRGKEKLETLSGMQMDCYGNGGIILGTGIHFPVKQQLSRCPLGHPDCFYRCEAEAERAQAAPRAHGSTQEYCREPRLQTNLLARGLPAPGGAGLVSWKTQNPRTFYLIYDLFSLP